MNRTEDLKLSEGISMKIVYCKEWALFRNEPHCVISEPEAKDKHKMENHMWQ